MSQGSAGSVRKNCVQRFSRMNAVPEGELIWFAAGKRGLIRHHAGRRRIRQAKVVRPANDIVKLLKDIEPGNFNAQTTFQRIQSKG